MSAEWVAIRIAFSLENNLDVDVVPSERPETWTRWDHSKYWKRSDLSPNIQLLEWGHAGYNPRTLWLGIRKEVS